MNFAARAYLLGYNCADEKELEAALRFCWIPEREPSNKKCRLLFRLGIMFNSDNYVCNLYYLKIDMIGVLVNIQKKKEEKRQTYFVRYFYCFRFMYGLYFVIVSKFFNFFFFRILLYFFFLIQNVSLQIICIKYFLRMHQCANAAGSARVMSRENPNPHPFWSMRLV